MEDDISRYKVIIIMGLCTIQDDGNNLGGRKDEVERMAELLRETDINNLMNELNTMERNDRKKLKELANQAFVFLAFYGNATGMTVVVNGQYSPRDNQNWLGFLKMAWDFQAGLVSGILKAGLDELKSTWELITTNPLETLKSIACLIKLIITDPGSIIKAFVNMIGDKGEEAINAFDKGDLYKFGLIIGACATAIAIIFVPVPVGKLTGATKIAKGIKNVAEGSKFDDIALLSERINNAATNVKLTKHGSFRIEKGATPDADELRACEDFANQGYDLTFQQTASNKGIDDIRTADLDIKGDGKVDIYTPKTTNVNRIVSNIECKAKQGNGVIVQIDLDAETMASIANRIWGKPTCRNMTVIFFHKSDGTIIRFVRPVNGG